MQACIFAPAQARQLTAWTRELQHRSFQQRHLLELVVGQQPTLPGFTQPLPLAEPATSPSSSMDSSSINSSSMDNSGEDSSNSSAASSSSSGSGSSGTAGMQLLLPSGSPEGDELSAASSLFSHLDLDGDGRLSVEELAALMEELGVPQSRAGASTLLALLDSNGDSRVSLEEFIDFFRSNGRAQLLQQEQQQQQGRQKLLSAPDVRPESAGPAPSSSSSSSSSRSSSYESDSNNNVKGSTGSIGSESERESSINWQAIVPAAPAGSRQQPSQHVRHAVSAQHSQGSSSNQVSLAHRPQRNTTGSTADDASSTSTSSNSSSSSIARSGRGGRGSSSSSSTSRSEAAAYRSRAQRSMAGHSSRGGAVVMAGLLDLTGDDEADEGGAQDAAPAPASSSSNRASAPSSAGVAGEEDTAERARSGSFASTSTSSSNTTSSTAAASRGSRARINMLRPLVSPEPSPAEAAGNPPDGPPMLAAPRSLRRPTRSAHESFQEDGQSSGDEEGAALPPLPGSVPMLMLVPTGAAALQDRQGRVLQVSAVPGWRVCALGVVVAAVSSILSDDTGAGMLK